MESQTQTQSGGGAITKAQIREALRARGWEKKWLWGAARYDLPDSSRREKACLDYAVRMLSRGHLPDPELMSETLQGTKSVPQCGHLGCTWDAEHVH